MPVRSRVDGVSHRATDTPGIPLSSIISTTQPTSGGSDSWASLNTSFLFFSYPESILSWAALSPDAFLPGGQFLRAEPSLSASGCTFRKSHEERPSRAWAVSPHPHGDSLKRGSQSPHLDWGSLETGRVFSERGSLRTRQYLTQTGVS